MSVAALLPPTSGAIFGDDGEVLLAAVAGAAGVHHADARVQPGPVGFVGHGRPVLAAHQVHVEVGEGRVADLAEARALRLRPRPMEVDRLLRLAVGNWSRRCVSLALGRLDTVPATAEERKQLTPQLRTSNL